MLDFDDEDTVLAAEAGEGPEKSERPDDDGPSVPLDVLRELLEQKSSGISFASVDDAALAIASPRLSDAISYRGKRAAQIAEWVAGHRDAVSSSRESWHALFNMLLGGSDRPSYTREALEVARAGLSFFPSDTSLLGDALCAAGKVADWERGDVLAARAEGIDTRYVNDWYMPVMLSEYYRARARAESSDVRGAYLQKALDCLRAAKQHLPNEDRVINQEAEILIEMNDLASARALLDDAIFAKHLDSDGVERHFMMPQCCVTYLDDLLGDTDDYDRVIEVATIGIRASGIDEKSVNTGYFIFRLALGKDCKIHAASNSANGYGNSELVRDALRTFALAYSLDSSSSHREIIRDRFTILSVMGGVSDVSLTQYCRDGEKASGDEGED